MLARAAYQNAKTVLLDQILNSLDAKVRKRVLKNLILDYWNDTTRIMVAATIDQELFERADQVIVMKQGRINNAFQKNAFDYNTLRDFLPDEKVIQMNNESITKELSEEQSLKREEPGPEEQEKIKQASLRVLKQYFLALGSRPLLILFIALFILAQVIDAASIYIVPRFGGNTANPMLFASIYFGIALLLVITNVVRISIIYLGNVKAGEALHQQLLQRVSKLSFCSSVNNRTGHYPRVFPMI